MSVNRWGETETLLTLHKDKQMEGNCEHSFQMEYLDQLKVFLERKVLVMGKNIIDAIWNTIRKESPAILNSDENKWDWINQPDPPQRPEDDHTIPYWDLPELDEEDDPTFTLTPANMIEAVQLNSKVIHDF